MTTISQEAPPSLAIMSSDTPPSQTIMKTEAPPMMTPEAPPIHDMVRPKAPPTGGLSLLLQFARHLFSSVTVVGINHNTGALRLELKFTPEMADVVNNIAHVDRCLLIRAIGKLMYNMYALQQIDNKKNNISTTIYSEYSNYHHATEYTKRKRQRKLKAISSKSSKSSKSAKSAKTSKSAKSAKSTKTSKSAKPAQPMSNACAEDQIVQEQTSAVENLLSLYELEVVAVGGETVTLTSGDTLQWADTLEETISEPEQVGLSAEGVAEVPEVRCTPDEMIVEPFMTLDEESGLLTHVPYNDVIDPDGQREGSGDLEHGDLEASPGQEIRVEYDHDSGKTFFTF